MGGICVTEKSNRAWLTGIISLRFFEIARFARAAGVAEIASRLISSDAPATCYISLGVKRSVKFGTGQCVHTDEPREPWYVPGPQAWHESVFPMSDTFSLKTPIAVLIRQR